MFKNKKEGMSVITVVVILLIVFGIGFLFSDEIETQINSWKVNNAREKLEETYAKVLEFNKNEDIRPPEYTYTDYRDSSNYMIKLSSKLKLSKFNSNTNFGTKILIIQRNNNYIFMAYEFKDGSRMISVNGKIYNKIYMPSDGKKYYGPEWLYKVKKK